MLNEEGTCFFRKSRSTFVQSLHFLFSNQDYQAVQAFYIRQLSMNFEKSNSSKFKVSNN